MQNKLDQVTKLLQLDIPSFYGVVKKLKALNQDTNANWLGSSSELALTGIKAEILGLKNEITGLKNRCAIVHSSIFRNANIATRTNPFKPLGEQESDAADFMPTFDGVTLIYCIYKATYMFEQCYENLLQLSSRLQPPYVHLTNPEFKPPKTLEEMQLQKLEFDSNVNKVQSYLYTLLDLATVEHQALSFLENLEKHMEKYYEYLNKKYTIDGEQIYKNVIASDLATTIINNIDANGELKNTKDPSKISAYTAAKAFDLVNFVKTTGIIQKSIENPSAFTGYIAEHLLIIKRIIITIKNASSNKIQIVSEILNDFGININQIFTDQTSFDILISNVSNLDPSSIVAGKNTKILSKEEQFANSFINETVEEVVKKLCDPSCSVSDLRDYILQRKANFVTQTQIENCFYTCRISGGNPFLGLAPGALEVIPSPKPNVKLENIRGSGFGEVKDFIRAIQNSIEFRDLFIATSPSKSADKSNCLLIGPPGTGKTLVMKALASQDGFAVITAQGSDFLTCWKGEDVKNPKRLFEQALRIHKETNHHVHICIDEIDAVLNSDRGHGETNLTLEFQILMDGMVDYDGISVWGATNNPERIPMPMIRRFPKVLIVGELSKDDRKALLKLYSDSLPCSNVNESDWDEAAKKLEGATGDVIRKICDIMWRDKISTFISGNKEKARELVEFLNKEKRFDIYSFDDKERFNFQQRLREHVSIDSKYLLDTVDNAIKQIAIHSEISTAKDSFGRAKKFVTDIKKENSSSLILTLS